MDVVAFEADDVYLPPVRGDEWREDLAADAFDVLLRGFVHVLGVPGCFSRQTFCVLGALRSDRLLAVL